jgi:Concanavalin A-like lectin/glucanases superfamily
VKPSRAALVAVAAAASVACSKGRLDAIELPPDALTSDLIAHYTFDDGSGTTVADHSGNKRDGTLVGGTWITDGKFGGALHLDGASYVTVDNFPNARSSFSVSTWTRTIQWTDGGYEAIATTEYVFDGGWEVNVLDSADGGTRLQAAFWDDTLNGYTYVDCRCLQQESDAWVNFAFVVDGSAHTMTVYLNGAVVSVVAAPNPIGPGTPQLFIGRWLRAGRLLIGDIDDMAIYGRALAPAEVQALLQQSPPDVP